MQNGWKFHVDGSRPKNNEIFVFGSNLAGIHGAGAAALAVVEYGAIPFKSSGHMGNSYAIPTKDRNYKYRLSKSQIQAHVDVFCEYTKRRHDLSFFVTSIGCGYAGYHPREIAPMFKGAINCDFPDQWSPYLFS